VVSSRARQAFFVLFLLGFVVRAAFLGHEGTNDVPYDINWGHETNRVGFAKYYYGNYFPLQYHVFQFVAWFSDRASLGSLLVFNSVNLAFDVGLFVVLVLLLRRLGANPAWAFVYWLHPYFLALAWLGYIDVQMAFFAGLGVLLVARSSTAAGTLLAGVPFGIALFLKPQTLTLAVLLCGFVVACLFRRDGRRQIARTAALLAVFPLALFVAYSIWFHEVGRGGRLLARTFVHFGDFQGAALTANALNLWQPVADLYRDTGEPVYAVRGPHVYQTLAEILTVLILVCAVAAVAWTARSRPLYVSLVLLFAFGTMTLPMTMTRAHENHFFLGAVFGLLALAVLRSRLLAVAFAVVLTLQFVNLFLLYGFSKSCCPSLGAPGAQDFYVAHLRNPAAYLTVLAFGVTMFSLFRHTLRHGTRPGSLGGGQGIQTGSSA